jgi:hypothetical protein
LIAAVPVWRSVHAEIDASLPGDGPDQARRLLGALGNIGS